MSRWGRGEAIVERQLSASELQSVLGASANGTPWLTKAARTIETAAGLTTVDPSSAITLAYDAARFAAMAVLAQQGLRAGGVGGDGGEGGGWHQGESLTQRHKGTKRLEAEPGGVNGAMHHLAACGEPQGGGI